MAKKKISTVAVEVKETKIETDTTTLSINITIPTKLFYIAEVLEESGSIDSIEKSFETHLDNYYKKVYQIIAPDKPTSEKKEPSKSKKSTKSVEEE
ncbi:MAG: hypothetical protein WAQ98_32370 [Blastocatellia bacterium]